MTRLNSAKERDSSVGISETRAASMSRVDEEASAAPKRPVAPEVDEEPPQRVDKLRPVRRVDCEGRARDLPLQRHRRGAAEHWMPLVNASVTT